MVADATPRVVLDALTEARPHRVHDDVATHLFRLANVVDDSSVEATLKEVTAAAVALI